ncbi:MAG: TlpA family protein disulfide reductase [Firmicutes bacterium]|nr:TlpA family protein disulfide reductase [Bacillota bacterium]
MKKYLLIFVICCLTLGSAACMDTVTPLAPPDEPPEIDEEEISELLYDYPVQKGHYIIENEQMGLSVGIPVRLMENMTILNGQFYLQDCPPETPPLNGMQVIYFPPGLLEETVAKLEENNTEEALNEAQQILYTRSRLLYSLQYYSAGLWDLWLSEGKSEADITGNDLNIELGRQNGRVYIYTEPDPIEDGLLEDELLSYHQALAALPAMRTYATVLEPAVVEVVKDKNTFPTFTAQDIYGEAVESSIFADYDLTMFNIWGTFCGPCIAEMPDLGELAAAMPQGTQLVGLVGDAINANTIELAQTIVDSTGANYLHIVPDMVLLNYLQKNIMAYPTTLFIDSQGKLVGEPLIGAMSRKMYEDALSARLNMLDR